MHCGNTVTPYDPDDSCVLINGKQELLKSFAERVSLVSDRLGIPPAGKNRQAALGNRFGVSQKAARKWLVGEGFPDTSITIKMAIEARVSYDWLMTGRAPMEVIDHPIAEDVNETEPTAKTVAMAGYKLFEDGTIGYIQWGDVASLERALRSK